MTDSGDGRAELGDLDPPDVRRIKIERTELTYQSPISTAHGPIDHREVVVLTLTDGEGRIGLGEAAPLANFTPELVNEAELAIHRWADDGTLPVGSPTARAAIDGALLDLTARAAGRPVHDLLAPDSSGIVPVSAFVSGDTPDDLASAAAEAVAGGHGTVKVKVAASPFPTDLARLTAVREAIGDKRLRIDANGGWAPGEASEHLARLAALDLELVEEPAAGLEALATVRATSPVPVAIDESARTIDDVRRAIALGSADLVVLKPSALGGPLVTAEVARVVTEAGLGLVVTSLLEGSVGIRSAAHLAAALGALDPAPGLAPATLLTADSGPPLLPTKGALVLD